MQQKVHAHPSAQTFDELGAYFGQRKNFSCAISAFERSLTLNAGAAATHYHLALAFLASGDASRSAQHLTIALKLDPKLPNGHMTLGAALNQMQRMDAAIDQFYLALQTDPHSVTTLDWLTKSLLSEHRLAEAIALLKSAPFDPVLQMNLVIAYSEAEDKDRATELLLEMAKRQPHSAKPHAALATLYNQQFRYQDAVAEFREALRLDSQDRTSRLGYANALIMAGDPRTASTALDPYLREHPKDFEALYLTGVAERLLGNYDKAKEVLLQAIALNPSHYDSRYNLGVALAKSGQAKQARKQLNIALEIDPTANEAHFALAAALRSLGLQDAAQRQLDIYRRGMARKQRQEEAAAKANQAQDYFKAGEIQKAIDSYEEALRTEPENSRTLYQLAMALDRKGDYTRERDMLLKVVELTPKSASAHNQLGYLFSQAGLSSDAEREFKTAILLNPHFAEAQNNLGSLYGQRGDDLSAELLFRQATKYDPGFATAFVNLGVTLASESKFREADLALQKALQIDPDNKDARRAHILVKAQLERQSPGSE